MDKHLSLKTGDIILFSSHSKDMLSYFSSLIKWGTHSDYTHVAMILKDPCFLDNPLEGLYVWQSGWEGKPDPQDNKTKLGVQITPLQEILNDYKNGGVFVRKINLDAKNIFNDKILKEIHKNVYDKPYDIILSDWIKGLIQKNNTPQITSRFWCSALVGYIYTKVGILDENTDWTILRPCDFSLSAEKLNYKGNNKLDYKEIKLNF